MGGKPSEEVNVLIYFIYTLIFFYSIIHIQLQDLAKITRDNDKINTICKDILRIIFRMLKKAILKELMLYVCEHIVSNYSYYQYLKKVFILNNIYKIRLLDWGCYNDTRRAWMLVDKERLYYTTPHQFYGDPSREKGFYVGTYSSRNVRKHYIRYKYPGR